MTNLSLYEPTFPVSIKALEAVSPRRADVLKKDTIARWERAVYDRRSGDYGSVVRFPSYTVQKNGVMYAKPKVDYRAELLGRERAPFTCGMELEIEHKDPIGTFTRDQLGELLARYLNGAHYVCNDGSLRNGVEIVTAPRSESEIRSQYHKLHALLKELSRARWTSHDSGRCGLHIHISRSALSSDQWSALDKWILKPSIKPLFRKVSRRSAFNWCEFTSCRSSRYRAINFQNSSTVEFRFFRGTLKPESFLGSLELIFALVGFFADSERAKTIRSFVSFLQSDRRYKHGAALLLPIYIAARANGETTARRVLSPEEREARAAQRERNREEREARIAYDLRRILARIQDQFRCSPVGFNWGSDRSSVRIVERAFPVILEGQWRRELRERAESERLTVALPVIEGIDLAQYGNAIRWRRRLSWGRESGHARLASLPVTHPRIAEMMPQGAQDTAPNGWQSVTA